MILLAALLLPAAAGAQPARSPATAEESPADPAPAPPHPADLSHGPARGKATGPSPAVLAIPMPAGLEALPAGGWRLSFPAGTEAPPPGAEASLARLGRGLAAVPEGRVTLLAQVSGPVKDVSAARRLSLARGLAVKEALVSGGLAATRIDVRPMGRTPEAADAVDVQPPGLPAAPPQR
ncbi:hypothetical protein [Roseicella sp. DB1501]|uniref:hypothetical protein n=1 Tax=Roseicella sp. DB1501 TaxID=2730925 RepID=UPI0014928D49|nr:hypothetical protein [Roseicella sp. DB1501]NOG69207.1 hypothetical protein [Roseicella sp. DB1501]